MHYEKKEQPITFFSFFQSENPIYKECVTTVQNPMHETQFSKDNNLKADEKLMT